MSKDQNDDVLAQTDNFLVWRSREDDGYLYHIELGGLTLHFLPEEWDEVVTLIKEASPS